MSSVYMTRKKPVGAKIESVRYTAETLAASDYDIAVYDLNMSYNNELIERPISNGGLSKFAPITGKEDVGLTFKVDIAQSATDLGTAPTWFKLLRGCGMDLTEYAGVGYKAESVADNCDTLTMEFGYTGECSSPDEYVVKMKGCTGKWKLVAVTGALLTLEFEFKGSFVSITDRGSAISTANMEVSDPEVLRGSGATLTIAGYSNVHDVNQIEVDYNNTIEYELDMSQNSGYAGTHIVDRDITVAIDPQLQSVATRNFYTKMRSPSGNTNPMILRTTNFLIYAKKLQVTNALQFGDRSGIVTEGVNFKSVNAPDDDDIYILQGDVS